MSRARIALEQIARQAARVPALAIAASVANRASGSWPYVHTVLRTGDLLITWTGTAVYTATTAGSGTVQTTITLADGRSLLLVTGCTATNTVTISRTSGSAVAAIYEGADVADRVVQVQAASGKPAPVLILDVPEVDRGLIAVGARESTATLEALLLSPATSHTNPGEDYLTAADLAERLIEDVETLSAALGEPWQVVGSRVSSGIRQDPCEHRPGEILIALAWMLEAHG